MHGYEAITHARGSPRDGLGAVVWFTGLSGAGKSTIARQVYEGVRATGARAERLDGDAIRAPLSEDGIHENATRRARPTRRVSGQPARASRGIRDLRVDLTVSRLAVHVRRMCRRFVEVYVSTPLEMCEERYPKGLYARACRGELAHFTGLDDPYEPPANPELTIDTGRSSASDAAQQVLARLGVCSERCVTAGATV